MVLITRSRPQIGDVIEIPTSQGLAFAHFTHKHGSYGALLRVMPGLFDSPPDSFREIVWLEPQFSTFFPLNAACKRGILRVVANESICPVLKAFPTFRTSIKGRDGEWGPWWLWDGVKEWQVGKLQPGMEMMPPRGIINETLLIERIIGGWRHDHYC